MKYYVLKVLSEDIHSGHCWIKNQELKTRGLISIKNIENGKKVILEGLAIEKDYKKHYFEKNNSTTNKEIINNNKSILQISSWYRKKLGIEKTQKEYDLSIRPIKGCDIVSRIRSCINHPQLAVRIGTWLGCIGVIIGAISAYCNLVIQNGIFFIIGCAVGLSFSPDFLTKYICQLYKKITDNDRK